MSYENENQYDKELIKAISDNNNIVAKKLIDEHNLNIEYVDENTLTPLMHACYKGNVDLIKLLILYGADPNYSHHKDGYTPLMFAALSCKFSAVLMLLENNVDINVKNRLDKTASQMAAFVGYPSISNIIQNYIQMSSLQVILKDMAPSIIPNCCNSLLPNIHYLLNNSIASPIKILLYYQENPKLINNIPFILKLIEHFEDPSDGIDFNEYKSFKAFIICYMLNLVESNKRKLDYIIKKFVKCIRTKTNYNEEFMRMMIKAYKHKNSAIFRSIIFQISKIPLGTTSTLEILENIFIGTKENEIINRCCICLASDDLKVCQKCKKEYYCNTKCQKLDWPYHKQHCL